MSPERNLRVLVVDDHDVVHWGFRLLLTEQPWVERCLTATTVDEARWLEARGVDAIIAQGLEAGGHRGHFLSHDLTKQLGTFALLPQLVRALKVPVIAAGAVMTGAS